MDFLKPEVRRYFFHDEPRSTLRLMIFRLQVQCRIRRAQQSDRKRLYREQQKWENSILFKKVFVGKNCVIKNSIILNDVYIGDNTHIENCIVESRDTLKANTYYCGDNGIKIVSENNERYVL